jgi:Holliday junction DNA helicase RuvA
MIATLNGTILSKGTDRAVIDVSGVGYEVFLTTDSLARLPDTHEEMFLFIHTNVREDAIVLYGFLDEAEKDMFLNLTSVSGVGPKLGLAALSGLRAVDLAEAIAARDVKRLTSLQGVGKKTAERICVELKDKVGHLAAGASLVGDGTGTAPAPGSSSAVLDVLSVLANLGYSDPVSRQALTTVKKRMGDETFYEASVEDLTRECLRTLA